MRIILIRRAETERNAALRYQGQANVPLDERGRRQAALLGARLRRYDARALYSSDIRRAAETAEIVGAATGLTPRPLPELREIDISQWEDLTPEDLYRRYPDHLREYERNPARALRPGGESYAELQARALAALETIRLAHPDDETALAVTHGGFIRAVLSQVIGLRLADYSRIWIDAASLSAVQSGSGGWRLTRLNDTAHLEAME